MFVYRIIIFFRLLDSYPVSHSAHVWTLEFLAELFGLGEILFVRSRDCSPPSSLPGLPSLASFEVSAGGPCQIQKSILLASTVVPYQYNTLRTVLYCLKPSYGQPRPSHLLLQKSLRISDSISSAFTFAALCILNLAASSMDLLSQWLLSASPFCHTTYQRLQRSNHGWLDRNSMLTPPRPSVERQNPSKPG